MAVRLLSRYYHLLFVILLELGMLFIIVLLGFILRILLRFGLRILGSSHFQLREHVIHNLIKSTTPSFFMG
jgi:hypothetical protein